MTRSTAHQKSESVVCTTIVRPTGWYPQLFYDPDSSDEQDTIIADITAHE